MNLAFQAFFILFLMLPGFLYIKRYDKKENTTLESKGLDATSAQSVFATLILHTVSLTISYFLFCKSVDYSIIIKILTNEKLQPIDINKIIDSRRWIISYFFLVFTLAYASGLALQKLMFKLNPYKSSAFAFNLPWYYELKGKIEPTSIDKNSVSEFIRITCMIVSGKNTYLYSGILNDFYLNIDGSLDRIAIIGISRLELKNNSHRGKEETINVDRMILKYNEIQNLTLEYLIAIKQ
ncbi:hypothetical protein ACP3TC_06820 [Winslowiella sp. 2C04]|uniref:hypothetical protein n=1 Tax=Winslowiella sp. 2C04 TaxID=3416179 RepID=UPI003CE72E54